LLIAGFIISFVIQAFKIPSGSMIPTLLVGDHLFVNKFIYGVKLPYFRTTLIPVTDPKREDVIVFVYPEDRSKDFIKRVIGVAGDKIEMKNKKLFLNDKPYADPTVLHRSGDLSGRSPAARQLRPVVVPEKSLFVMGDNRDHSLDSRFWGFVDLRDVQGKAFILYWSWNRDENTSAGAAWPS
jgi:signal peptidase I